MRMTITVDIPLTINDVQDLVVAVDFVDDDEPITKENVRPAHVLQLLGTIDYDILEESWEE
jgi:hypothetical protein